MTTITNQTTNAIIMNVSATLVRKQLCMPKEALGLAVAFSENVERLLGSTTDWADKITLSYNECLIDGESLGHQDIIGNLQTCGYIDNLLDSGVYVSGTSTNRIIDEVRTSYAPAEAVMGIVRRRDYATINTSPLFKEAIHALEATMFMKSDEMMDIAQSVYENIPGNRKLKAQQYVIDGTMDMQSDKAYVSEFFGDKRGRMYQAACYGPNGQSSDMARALMDLYGVSQDYDVKQTKKLLVAEMKDMGKWTNKEGFKKDMEVACKYPVAFIEDHIGKDYHISKPWNFVKFALIMEQLLKGNKPYIGVAVGLDAKCSGPQLGACIVGDENMMEATGFTSKLVDDAYHRALQMVRDAGITGLSRATIKKSFMSVYYGAGEAAMMDANTIQPETWEILYTGKTPEEMEEIAGIYHTAIIRSFGVKLNNLRAKIKQGGYDFDMEVEKFDKPVRHFMPDGLEVAMEYKQKLDINGDLVTHSNPAISTTKVECGLISKTFRNMSFNLEEYNLADFARTGFVNMIQATDALLARLIVVHANRLGAQHIIAVHDCFRVNIHDMAILEEAIKLAYLDLFSSKNNEVTKDMPLGKDIIGLYFDGAEKATKPEYKEEALHASQFYGKSAIRRMDEVKGVSFTNLVLDLGNTTYFAK